MIGGAKTRNLLSNRLIMGFLAFALLFASCFVFPVHAQTASELGLGVIRILADGTVEGTDKIARSGNTYTLTDNISVQLTNGLGEELKPCIIIMKDNVVVNGAGHTIQSNGTGLGIFARGVQGVTIENFKIRGFVLGISTYVMDEIVPIELLYKKTANNQILNNDIETVREQTLYMEECGGIFIEFSENMVISGNTVKAAEPRRGLYVGATCNQTTITNNKFIECGLDMYTLKEKTMSGNTIDGDPVVFVSGKTNQVIETGEQVFIYNSKNITVRNIEPHNDYRRTIQVEKTAESSVTGCKGIIALTGSSNNSIYGNPAKDISIFQNSNYNKIFGNNLTGGYIIYDRATSEFDYARRCIDLYGSYCNEIYGNTITGTHQAIHLGEPEIASQYNRIYQNSIYNVSTAVMISYSPENYVYSNRIWNCSVGIDLSVTGSTVAAQNNISDCKLALEVMGSNNQFYHNNLINNTKQATVNHQMLFSSDIIYAYSINNTFDAGSIIGGNYWSDLQGVDSNSDGISETPYIIDANNTDHYPLMQPRTSNFTPPAFPTVDSPGPEPFTDPTPAPSPSAKENSYVSESGNSPTPTPTSSTLLTLPEVQAWIILPLILVLSLIAAAKLRKTSAR